jgi:hypothetical protein
MHRNKNRFRVPISQNPATPRILRAGPVWRAEFSVSCLTKISHPTELSPDGKLFFAAHAKQHETAHDCSTSPPVYDRANINNNASQGELS